MAGRYYYRHRGHNGYISLRLQLQSETAAHSAASSDVIAILDLRSQRWMQVTPKMRASNKSQLWITTAEGNLLYVSEPTPDITSPSTGNQAADKKKKRDRYVCIMPIE